MWQILRRAWAWLADTPTEPVMLPDPPAGHPDTIPPPRLAACERDCGRGGKIVWRSVDGAELTLCAADNARHEYALIEQGWQQAYVLEPA